MARQRSSGCSSANGRLLLIGRHVFSFARARLAAGVFGVRWLGYQDRLGGFIVMSILAGVALRLLGALSRGPTL